MTHIQGSAGEIHELAGYAIRTKARSRASRASSTGGGDTTGRASAGEDRLFERIDLNGDELATYGVAIGWRRITDWRRARGPCITLPPNPGREQRWRVPPCRTEE
jgi:hypothetical protein